MFKTVTLDIQNIRNELCEVLRRSDILTTTIRGVTRTTGNYTVGVGGESAHTFTGNIPVKDFYSLTVNSINKYFLRDYTINWATGVLTWNVALVNNDNVAYQIDWGSSGDKIYPDLPRDDLTLTSYPRVGIELTSISTTPLGLGGDTHISDLVITVIAWVSANKDSSIAGGFGGLSDLSGLVKNIRDTLRTNAKSFYTFQYITPVSTGPLIKGEDGKIMQQTSDYRIKFKVE